MIKKLFLTTISILILVFFSCKKEPKEKFVTFLLKNDFSVKIEKPSKNRDYSYHNGGVVGVFDDPESIKDFYGSIKAGQGVSKDDLVVEWYSNIDSTLFIGSPDSDLRSHISTKLSIGLHKLYFKVTHKLYPFLYHTDSISISNVISLNTIKSDKSIKLTWTKYNDNDFISYLVYRNADNPIEISNQSDTTYEDFDIFYDTDSTRYQIVVKKTVEPIIPYGSNIVKSKTGMVFKIDHYVSKMISDPKRKYVYGIIDPGKYSYASQYGLLIFGVSKNNIVLIKHLYPNYRFTDLDISPDGESLFLCSDSKIIQIDLNNQTLIKEINTQYYIHKVEVGLNNRLYCHETPPSSGGSPLIIINFATEEVYSECQNIYSEFRHGDIEYNLNNNMLYHGQGNLSYCELIKYDISSDTAIAGGLRGYFNYPDDLLIISPNGQNIFWQDTQYDQNLNIVRTYNTKIVSSSQNSEMVSDYRTIYNTSDFSTKLKLPLVPVFSFTYGSCFANSDSLIVNYISDEPLYQTYETYLTIFSIKD